MGPARVVPVDPLRDDSTCLGKDCETLKPDTFLLQAAEESFNHPVLLRTVGRDELLLQAILPASRPETLGTEDQAIVRVKHRAVASYSKSTEPVDASGLQGPSGPWNVLAGPARIRRSPGHGNRSQHSNAPSRSAGSGFTSLLRHKQVPCWWLGCIGRHFGR